MLQSLHLKTFIVGSKLIHESQYLSWKLYCTTRRTFSGHDVPVHCGISRIYNLDSPLISDTNSRIYVRVYVIAIVINKVMQTYL